VWSSFIGSLPFIGNKDNSTSTSTVAPVIEKNATTSTTTLPQPCVPEETLSPSLQYLHDHLPPQYAALITEDNVEVFQEVGTLAGLATSAATGNPIAIVKLVMFLTSPENPIPELFTLTKEILPLIKPSEITASFGNMANSTATNINQEVEAFKQNFLNLFKKPEAAPSTSNATTVLA
jgi:hypothetical protein